MALPVLIFVVFNALYITMGFLYLSVVSVPQRPQEEETSLLRTQTDSTLYWTGFIFVSGFTLNLVSRLEAGKACQWDGGCFRVGLKSCWCLRRVRW